MERLISLSLARRSIEYARRAAWRRTVFAKFLSHLGARIDPKSQDVCMREESSCLVKRESYPISCGGGGTVSRSSRPRSWVGLQASAADHPTKVLSRLYGGCIDHARDERLLVSCLRNI